MELLHGGDVYSAENRGAVDFSANINPLGLPQSVRVALCGALDDCGRYPDPLCRSLRTAIGKFEDVPPENIFCSNGASEILYRIAWAFRPRRALLTAPAFSEYRQSAQSVGCDVRLCNLREETGFAMEKEMISLIDETIDVVYLCNPNNPTGLTIGRDFVEKIAFRCRQIGALLVVDECFMDFVLDVVQTSSAKPLLQNYDNIILLKAFTKIFAMPGVRLGYCLTYNQKTIEKLNYCGQPWSVSAFAQAAGIAAAGEVDFIRESCEYVQKERETLKSALSSCGLKVFDSMANFILFRAEGIYDLKEKMLQKGYLIRSCSNYDGLDGSFYRIAVRTRKENQGLIKSLEALL